MPDLPQGDLDLLPTTVRQGGRPASIVAWDASLSVTSLTSSTGPDGLWWLGGAGFAWRVGNETLLIDPYLSDSLATKYAGTVFPHHRLHPAPVDAAKLRGVVGVLHTHGHTDHLDPWTNRDLHVGNRPSHVAPAARRELALARDIPAELLVGLDAGEATTIGRFSVAAVPAAHESLTTDDLGRHHFLGYVIEADGVRVYHSGDCIPFAGQGEMLAALGIDLALLPINGRDAHRANNGVPGNFTVHEAVSLCRSAGIPALLGHHFGLFDFNTIAPAEAARCLTDVHDLEWTLPAVGAGFRLSKKEGR